MLTLHCLRPHLLPSVHVCHSLLQVSLSNILTVGNMAEQGGALAISDNASLSLQGGVSSNNSAVSGGVVHLSGRGSASLTDFAAANNSAQSGGALFADNASHVSPRHVVC